MILCQLYSCLCATTANSSIEMAMADSTAGSSTSSVSIGSVVLGQDVKLVAMNKWQCSLHCNNLYDCKALAKVVTSSATKFKSSDWHYYSASTIYPSLAGYMCIKL